MKYHGDSKTPYSIRWSRSTGRWYVINHKVPTIPQYEGSTTWPRHGGSLLASGFRDIPDAMSYLSRRLRRANHFPPLTSS